MAPTKFILESPCHWDDWLGQHKLFATTNEIWCYCDPYKAEHEVIPLLEPPFPSFASHEAPQQGHTGGEQGSQGPQGRNMRPSTTIQRPDSATPQSSAEASAEDTSGQDDRQTTQTAPSTGPTIAPELRFKLWEFQNKQYEKKKTKLNEMVTRIQDTLATQHQYLINDQGSVHAMLRALHQHLSPTAGSRERELKAQWNKLSKKQTDVETWLKDWERVYTLCALAKLADVQGISPYIDFCNAFTQVYPEWAYKQSFELQTEYEEGGIAALPSFQKLVQRVRNFHRSLPPRTNARYGTFVATAQEPKKASNTQEVKKSVKYQNQNTKPEPCVCGKPHLLKNCWYLATEHPSRPSTFTPNQSVVEDIKNKLRNKDTLQRVKTSFEEANRSFNEELFPSKSTTTGIIAASSAAQYVAMDASHEPQKPNLSWIYDCGSNIHITNHKNDTWKTLRKAAPEERVKSGSQELQIVEWGYTLADAIAPNGTSAKYELNEVAFVPGFHLNCLSGSLAKAHGLLLNMENDMLYELKTRKNVIKLTFENGLWYIFKESQDAQNAGYSATSVAPKKPILVTPRRAHELFAHLSPIAIAQLNNNVEGIVVDSAGEQAPSFGACETCIQAKMTEIVSRRTPADRAERPFFRIAADLVQLRKNDAKCLNGDRFLFHAVDEYTKWHEVCTLKRKDKDTLRTTLQDLLAKIKTQFNQQLVAIKLDNERGFNTEFETVIKEAGIKLELRAPDTPAQLGLAERAGSVLTTKARALRIHTGLPKSLTHELVVISARIANCTPVQRNEWKTPYEMVYSRKPNVAHFKLIGQKAFILNKHLPRGEKLQERAIPGFLLGWRSTNIYRVWFPELRSVRDFRDVVSFEGSTYKDHKPEHFEPEEATLARTTRSQNEVDSDSEIDDAERITSPTPSSPTKEAQEGDQSNWGGEEGKPERPEMAYMTPPATERGNSTASEGSGDSPDLSNDAFEAPAGSSVFEQTLDPTHDDSGDDSEPMEDEIVIQPNYSAYATTASSCPPPEELGETYAYFNAIAQASYSKPHEKAEGNPKLHRDRIPPAPQGYKQACKHQFSKDWQVAMKLELDTCWAKNCFERVEKRPPPDAEVLPLMWVFAYKFDEKGFVARFKARLVIRGDLQTQWDTTYAATLAIRTFRALMAIAAALKLEIWQFDAISAFLNCKMDRQVFCHTPDGYAKEYGPFVALLKALYGLKEAPYMWHQELSSTLVELGLKPVHGVDCLFQDDKVIVFFYVDDIVVLVHPQHRAHFRELMEKLKKKYELRELGALEWFLGIQVERSPDKNRIWLHQRSYIEKVVNKFKIDVTKRATTPLPTNGLKPSEDEPDSARTKLFQELVGHLVYTTGTIHIATAYPHSAYAQFLQNAGKAHIAAVHHTWRYLWHHRNDAISASGEHIGNAFSGSADAAFADDMATRRSSFGWVFHLFGMPVDWKAGLQKCVVKSTTEAELYAISHAGSELLWWKRFFKGINYDITFDPVLCNDNTQAVDICNDAIKRIHTKLRHVDIQQMWIREQTKFETLRVEWINTASMPADGLTKPLSRQKHETFLKLNNVQETPSAKSMMPN